MISHNLWWTCEKRYNKALFSLLWQQRPSWNGVAICMEAAILYRIVSFKYMVSPGPLESSHHVQIPTICLEKNFNSHWCNTLARCPKFDWTYSRQQCMHITLQELKSFCKHFHHSLDGQQCNCNNPEMPKKIKKVFFSPFHYSLRQISWSSFFHMFWAGKILVPFQIQKKLSAVGFECTSHWNLEY